MHDGNGVFIPLAFSRPDAGNRRQAKMNPNIHVVTGSLLERFFTQKS
jgi:hypothetical protein